MWETQRLFHISTGTLSASIRFDRLKDEVMQGLYNGKSLSPNDGVLAPLMKHLLESMMDGELENHLQEEKLWIFLLLK